MSVAPKRFEMREASSSPCTFDSKRSVTPETLSVTEPEMPCAESADVKEKTTFSCCDFSVRACARSSAARARVCSMRALMRAASSTRFFRSASYCSCCDWGEDFDGGADLPPRLPALARAGETRPPDVMRSDSRRAVNLGDLFRIAMLSPWKFSRPRRAKSQRGGITATRVAATRRPKTVGSELGWRKKFRETALAGAPSKDCYVE